MFQGIFGLEAAPVLEFGYAGGDVFSINGGRSPKGHAKPAVYARARLTSLP